MRPLIVAANWKMNGNLAFAADLRAALEEKLTKDIAATCIICPPAVYIGALVDLFEGSKVKVGAQNTHNFDGGAYTGDISALMIKDIGCSHVIIGHSERRAGYGESDELIFAKLLNAQCAGLTPILCVGESLEEREQGKTESILAGQLENVLEDVSCLQGAVMAYEPVWAIGTGKTATPDMAQAAHAYIRGLVAKKDKAIAASLPILYGGSVNGSNASALFAEQDIDGGLVGGASLKIDEFLEIVTCTKYC